MVLSLTVTLVSMGLISSVGAGNIKKKYINVSKEGEQVTSIDIPANYGQIEAKFNSFVYEAKGIYTTRSGNFLQEEGKLGKSFKFNGTDNALTSNSSFNSKFPSGSSPRTIEAWIKPESDKKRGHIVSYGKVPYSYNTFDFEINGWTVDGQGYLVIHIWSDAIKSQNKIITENLNKWIHVAVTYSGGSLMSGTKLYLNGVEIPKQAYVSGMAGTNTPNTIIDNFYIGRRGDSNSSSTAQVYNSFFQGNMDEVRVWNTVRTPEQIKSYMNKSLIGNEPGLVGYWNFDY